MVISAKIELESKRVNYIDFDFNMPICVIEMGWEKTPSNHTWTPNGRPRYLIHLIKQGKGTIQREDGTITKLSKGDFFINAPDEGSIVKSDINEPFEYYWIAFNGAYAKKIINEATNKKHGKYKGSAIIAIRELLDNSICDHIGTLNALFTVLNCIKSEALTNEDFVKKAVLYIESNYYKSFDVGEYAKSIGVSRSHFTTVFTKKTGFSPYDFLTKIRIDNAIKYLLNTNMSVSQIAYKMGFTSLDRFGKMFKARTGMSAREYRSSNVSIT